MGFRMSAGLAHVLLSNFSLCSFEFRLFDTLAVLIFHLLLGRLSVEISNHFKSLDWSLAANEEDNVERFVKIASNMQWNFT